LPKFPPQFNCGEVKMRSHFENYERGQSTMSLQVRRTVVWVLSIVLGVAASGGIIFGLFQTTIEKYLTLNAVLLAAAFIALFWIWLDYVFSTEMLPK